MMIVQITQSPVVYGAKIVTKIQPINEAQLLQDQKAQMWLIWFILSNVNRYCKFLQTRTSPIIETIV